jgi:hypothetical protein
VPLKTAIRVIVSLCLVAGLIPASADVQPVTTLSTAYQLMYNLNFDGATQIFTKLQQQRPDDPMVPASEAAGLLFSEFHRLGVLEAQFYENDKAFDGRKKLEPDAAIRSRFNTALGQAETRANARLAKNDKDRDALFALTMASGLKADYAALIEKRNLASLRYTKDASTMAQRLLVVDPKCYDAYLATGIGKYIIGSMSAPVRWFLRMGGFETDKNEGIQELKLTAEKGTYLGPFARILLAIAYVRDKDKPKAREILSSLQTEFPNNPLFAREIARLDSNK